jgi:hypothetical protein
MPPFMTVPLGIMFPLFPASPLRSLVRFGNNIRVDGRFVLLIHKKEVPLEFRDHGRRSEVSASLSREARHHGQKTVAEEIPEGFRSAKPGRTASGGQ